MVALRRIALLAELAERIAKIYKADMSPLTSKSASAVNLAAPTSAWLFS